MVWGHACQVHPLLVENYYFNACQDLPSMSILHFFGALSQISDSLLQNKPLPPSTRQRCGIGINAICRVRGAPPTGVSTTPATRYSWQVLVSNQPQNKFCYGILLRRLLRRYRPRSAVSCSAIWKRTAGSSPNTSQVSLRQRPASVIEQPTHSKHVSIPPVSHW